MAEDVKTSDQLGPNAWLVDDMYEQYTKDPSTVSESWREFFEGYQPGGVNLVGPGSAPGTAAAAANAAAGAAAASPLAPAAGGGAGPGPVGAGSAPAATPPLAGAAPV